MATGKVSVLKKIGIVIAEAGADITKFLGFPFISQILGLIPGKLGQEVTTGVADLNTFAGFVSIGEAMYQSESGQKLGSQKLAAVAPLFQNAVQLWAKSALPGHNKLIVTPDVFADHCKALASDMADILNDFGE